MPITVRRVDALGSGEMSRAIHKELQRQLVNAAASTEHWELDISTANGQFLVSCRGPHERRATPATWTRSGTEGGPAGDVRVYESAVEIGDHQDMTPTVAKVASAVREFLDAR